MLHLNIRYNIKRGLFLFTSLFFIIFSFHSAHSAVTRESPIVKAVRMASTAVVNISSEYEISKHENPFSNFHMDPFFDNFFKDFMHPNFEKREKRTSLGSGVIIEGKRGFILTNAHVIEKTSIIKVILKDKREYVARIVGMDIDSDLAVLKIETKETIPSIEMGDSSDIMIGETVIAIGNPFGFSNTVTTGVISAVDRSVRTNDRVFHSFLQTDASINPGNSGGPLLNINGELIGINTAIYAKAQGIGFAIPINKAKRIVNDLITYGEVIQAWVGIGVQNIDERLAAYLKLDKKQGVIVTDIEEKSPAEKGGIKEGDIILSIDSKPVFSMDNYNVYLKNIPAGKTINILIQRNMKTIQMAVKTDIFPVARSMDLSYSLLGVRVKKSSRTKGVVISDIKETSFLSSIGVRPGDIIRGMNELVINDISDFQSAIIKYRRKDAVVVLLQRQNRLYYVNVEF